MDINAAQAFASFVFGALGGGAGAYLGSYLKKKGENVATHEDIDKLVEQVSAVTKTTKEIEAKISNEVWDRQKQWEFKKEAVFEVLKAVGSLHSSMVSLHATYKGTPGDELHERNRVSIPTPNSAGYTTTSRVRPASRRSSSTRTWTPIFPTSRSSLYK